MKAIVGSSGETSIPTYCAMCGALCAVHAIVKDGKFIGVKQMTEGPGDGSICPKGAAAPQIVYDPQRLKYPMKRTRPKNEKDPGWVRISWDEALDIAAFKLKELAQKYGPESVYVHRPAQAGSATRDHEEFIRRLAYLYGTPNILSATHICQWHRDASSRFTYGEPTPFPDIQNTKCLLLWGTNPFATNARQATSIKKAKEKGAMLIVVDPVRCETVEMADIWLQVRPTSDLPLMLSMINVILNENLYDHNFVTQWTNGPFLVRDDTKALLRESDIQPGGSTKKFVVWDRQRSDIQLFDTETMTYSGGSSDPALEGNFDVKLTDGSTVSCRPVLQLLSDSVEQIPPEKAQEICWVEAGKIRESARKLATIKPASYWTYNGIEMQTYATQTARALGILYSLTGDYGKVGGNSIRIFAASPIPVNSARTPDLLPEERAKKRIGRDMRPLGPGSSPQGDIQADVLYDAILTEKPYPIKGGMVFGGNAIMTQANSIRGREALRKLDFLMVAEMYMTPVAELADIVLPVSTCWESEYPRAGMYGEPPYNSYIMLRRRIVEPQWESWPDLKIAFELAKRLGFGDKFWNGNIEEALNYILKPTGLTLEKLREMPYTTAPVKMEFEKYANRYANIDEATGRPRGFQTSSKRIELYSTVLHQAGEDPMPVYREPPLSPLIDGELQRKYPLVLTIQKVVEFNHSSHRSVPSLRKGYPEPYVLVHPKTASERGIADGEWVQIETWEGRIRMKAMYSEKMHPRVVVTNYGWWQGCDKLGSPSYDPYSEDGANINLIQHFDYPDRISGSLPHNGWLCELRKAN